MVNTIKVILRSENKYFLGFALCVGILSIFDLSVDLNRGVKYLHILLEAIVVLISITVVIKIIVNERLHKNSILAKFNNLEKESFQLRTDIQKFKTASQKYVTGISDLIDQQLNDWELSKSEKEVALLLLKGLSHKEIALIRNTAEKTVRHQSGIVYSKANLEGRAQLSAFFLEDLLYSNSHSS